MPPPITRFVEPIIEPRFEILVFCSTDPMIEKVGPKTNVNR